jgi:hypothetical protein
MRITTRQLEELAKFGRVKKRAGWVEMGRAGPLKQVGLL